MLRGFTAPGTSVYAKRLMPVHGGRPVSPESARSAVAGSRSSAGSRRCAASPAGTTRTGWPSSSKAAWESRGGDEPSGPRHREHVTVPGRADPRRLLGARRWIHRVLRGGASFTGRPSGCPGVAAEGATRPGVTRAARSPADDEPECRARSHAIAEKAFPKRSQVVKTRVNFAEISRFSWGCRTCPVPAVPSGTSFLPAKTSPIGP